MTPGQLHALEYAVERFEHYAERQSDAKMVAYDRRKVDAARDALAAAWADYKRTLQGDLFAPGVDGGNG